MRNADVLIVYAMDHADLDLDEEE